MSDLSMTPDLRELLGEIADDPRAQLLRVRSAQAAREGLDRNPKVSSSAPFLRKAERRLLELHREELGRLLYAYAHIVRMQSPENALRVHYQDCKIEPQSKARIDRRARALLATKGAEEPESELLRKCLESSDRIRPTEIIGAVMRVAPSDKVQVMFGTDLSLEGAIQDARAVLKSVLDRGIESRYASYVWETLGFIKVRAGELREAADHYESAILADPARIVPALFWLWFSLLTLSKESALRAARFIDHHVHPSSSALAWFRQLGAADPGPKSSRDQRVLAILIADQSGPVTRSVIDGF